MDEADSLYTGDSAVIKIHPTLEGPYLSSEGGDVAEGPFLAGNTIFYNIGYQTDGAESWTVPDPYGSSSPLYDDYKDVKLVLTLPEGLVLATSARPYSTETNLDGSTTYTILVADSLPADTSKSGNFFISVYIGNNGTEEAIHNYNMKDMLALTAKWELVDRMEPEGSDGYYINHEHVYSQTDTVSGNNFSTTSPDVWGLRKTLVEEDADKRIVGDTLTFTWTVNVGLEGENGLITNLSEYERDGADKVESLMLDESMVGQYLPAGGSAEPISRRAFQIRKGTTGE